MFVIVFNFYQNRAIWTESYWCSTFLQLAHIEGDLILIMMQTFFQCFTWFLLSNPSLSLKQALGKSMKRKYSTACSLKTVTGGFIEWRSLHECTVVWSNKQDHCMHLDSFFNQLLNNSTVSLWLAVSHVHIFFSGNKV